MNCQETQDLLGIWFDDELDPLNSLAIEKHLEECAECAAAWERMQALRSAIRSHAPYYVAPPALRALPEERKRWIPWVALGAAAAVLLAIAVAPRFAPRAERDLEQEVVSAHLRSLMANHLMDVASTDRHTVKPWFAGKLDFAPVVEDLSDGGFPLVGGRLDYIGDRAVAALVYQHRKHTINVFTWPATGESAVRVDVVHGFHVAHWRHEGMEWWAVSDVAGEDLQALAGEVVKRK